MAVRLTGMISGLDTDAVIQELVKAQKSKNKKTTDKKQLLEWKQEKWKELNTKLYKLYTGTVSNLRLQKNYLTKKAVGSDDTKVSITAQKDAPEGSHQVSVKQLASAQYVTSGKITTDGFSEKTKLADIGFAAGSSVITIKNGDEEQQLGVSSNTTVGDFLTACKSAGLNASYDSRQKRFFISSASSGVENAFSITTGNYTAQGAAAKADIEKLVNMSVSSTASSVNSCLVSLQKNGDTAQAEEQLIKLAKENSNADATAKATKYYNEILKRNTSLEEEEIKKIEEKHASIENEEERAEKIAEAKQKELDAKINSKLNSAEYQAKIKEAVANGLSESDAASELGLTDASETAEYTFADQAARDLTVETAMKSAIANYKAVYADGGGATKTSGTSPLAALGLGEIAASDEDKSASDTGSYTYVAAKNSIINYNGVELEDSSNTVSVNGLTIAIKGITDTPVSCSISRDTDSAYNMIKDFVKEYNEILKEMNTLYYAGSARGYNPLSDDERESMSDDQIEKWEAKIKDSLLRRDTSLGNVTNAMKNALQKSVTVKGKNYSLASLGIRTSTDYTEKGLLHIMGDAEDPLYKDHNNKLQQALTEDPDLVMEIMCGVAKELHSAMADKMKKTSMSSALTFYNDKEIENQIKTLNKRISKDETALKNLEDKYYSQFSKMETALAKLQQQQSSLAGLLGG
jgi:flagellar hook-associated protein 2